MRASYCTSGYCPPYPGSTVSAFVRTFRKTRPRIARTATAGPPLEHAHDHRPRADPADGEGCIEILADRLRGGPGVLAIEANFRASTLTVRYQPALVSPDQLNAFADESAACSRSASRPRSATRSGVLRVRAALRAARGPTTRHSSRPPTPGTGARRAPRRGGSIVDGVEVVRPLSDKPLGRHDDARGGRAFLRRRDGRDDDRVPRHAARGLRGRVHRAAELVSHVLYAAAAITAAGSPR